MNERQEKLKQLVGAAVAETRPVFATRYPFEGDAFPKTPAMDELLDTLRHSDAIYVLQEMMK